MFATLQAKVFLGLGVAAAALVLFFYIQHLQDTNKILRAENSKLEIIVTEQKAAIDENNRRNDVVDNVTREVNKIRQQNLKLKDSKIKKIDESVTAGNDREVGPLLRDFFNDGQ